MEEVEKFYNKPLVSIIVNCFNGKEYLRDCLDSIYKQTYQNWELIFWDNQSKDNSKDIFKEYKDERFKYYLSSNHTSLYEARDLAVKVCHGDFFTFCDVDDFWSEKRLEYLMPLFENKNVGIVYSNQWILDDKSKRKKKYTNKILPKGDLSSVIIDNPGVTILNSIIKKSEYYKLKNGFNKKYKLIGDFDFFVRVAKSCQFDCVQMPLVYYRLHDNNFTKKNRETELSEFEDWFRNIKSLLSQEELETIYQKILYKKVTILILKNNFLESIINIFKIKNNFKKLKLLLALLIPKKILGKIKEY